MSVHELSSYAFNAHGNDARLYNGIHDLERELPEARARIEKLRVYLLVFLDSAEDDPKAATFFDLRLLREVKEYVSPKARKEPTP